MKKSFFVFFLILPSFSYAMRSGSGGGGGLSSSNAILNSATLESKTLHVASGTVQNLSAINTTKLQISAGTGNILELYNAGASFATDSVVIFYDNAFGGAKTARAGFLQNQGNLYIKADGNSTRIEILQASGGINFYDEVGIKTGNQLYLYDNDNTNTVGFNTPTDVTSSYDITFAAAPPGSTQLLQMDSSGQISYTSSSGGGSSTLAVGTGTASNFTNNITSPTAAISFLGSQFGSVASGSTNYVRIVTAGVTATELGANSVQSSELDEADVEAGLEAVMDLQDMQGAVTDGQVPDTITATNYLLNSSAPITYVMIAATQNVTGSKNFTSPTTVSSTFTISAGTISANGINYRMPVTAPSGSQLLQAGAISGTVYPLTWATAGSADNLGNHVATTSLNMNGKQITSVSSITLAGTGFPVIESTHTVLAIQLTNSSDNDFEVGESSAQVSGEHVTTVSNTQTLTNKTLDANGTGNTLKKYDFAIFTHPSFLGSTTNNSFNTSSGTYLFGEGVFSNSVSSESNCVGYNWIVPPDLDSSVAIIATFTYTLGGADTGTHRYVLSYSQTANSAIPPSSLGSGTNGVNFDHAGDGSGASGDVEQVTGTLTSWESGLTTNRHTIIQVCRDGNAAQDGSSVNSMSGPLIIRYGITQ